MLAFLHTAQPHVETFDALLQELSAPQPVHHAVHPELLEQARNLGVSSADVAASVTSAIRSLESAGARFIVCTCSTIGGLAESSASAGCHVMRIDRPMAEAAVASGRPILVAAALESTFEPTLALLRQVAAEKGRTPELRQLPCTDAWPLFEAGDPAGYAGRIAERIAQSTQPGDVVVLAQASMAPAAEMFPHGDIHVLSSPRSGVETALALYANRAD